MHTSEASHQGRLEQETSCLGQIATSESAKAALRHHGMFIAHASQVNKSASLKAATGQDLREIKAAIEESAQSELPWLGEASTSCEAAGQHPLGTQATTVALQLNHILTGVGAGRQHAQQQHLHQAKVPVCCKHTVCRFVGMRVGKPCYASTRLNKASC